MFAAHLALLVHAGECPCFPGGCADRAAGQGGGNHPAQVSGGRLCKGQLPVVRVLPVISLPTEKRISMMWSMYREGHAGNPLSFIADADGCWCIAHRLVKFAFVTTLAIFIGG
jgi:hypothetical protein